MHIMSYGQDDIYAIHLCTGLYCTTFSLLDSYTPAPCYYFLTASALLKSIKTHPLTLRILLLISLYITLLFFFFITLLFIIKSLHLLPVRGGLTLEFLKEGKNYMMSETSQWAVKGESLQTSMLVIVAFLCLSTFSPICLLPYASMWEKPHITITIPHKGGVTVVFHASLPSLE